MKTQAYGIFFLLGMIFSTWMSLQAQTIDPTRMAAPAGEILKTQLTTFRAVELQGLVSSDGTNGVALIRVKGQEPIVVRGNGEFSVTAGGVPFRVKVLSVSDQGVRLAAEGLKESFQLPVSFQRRPGAYKPIPSNGLRYVEFQQVPLRQALQLLADQSQRNFVCSDAASQTKVSLLLRDISTESVIEELCKSHALWYAGMDGKSSSVRMLTMQEFQENLSSFQQEELSETFTLLYPNVTEIASIIQGLYAGRVILSLGNEDLMDEEMSDISRRFERFNVMNRAANSELMGDFSMQNSYSVGGGSRASRNGIYTLRPEGGLEKLLNDREEFQKLRPEEAKRIQQGLSQSQGTNQVANVLDPYRKQLPTIYVTASKRNNLLIVRTCDPRAMEDIRNLVKKIDRPTPMVLLEMKLIELTLTDDMKTVFDYQGSGDFTINGKHPTAWQGNYPADTLEQKAMSFQILNKHFTARIQALQERGNAKIVATPTLLTANNEVSQIFIGKEIPITRDVNSQTIITEKNVVTTPQTEIEFERVGTQLLVTPTINADRTVMLRLLQQNSNVSPEKGKIPVLNQSGTGEGSIVPIERPGAIQYVDVDIIESRSVTGSFIAKDEMAVAIGGLIRDEEGERLAGIPILMDIPYLGWLFRKTVKDKKRTELIILVKPHILTTPTESEAVTGQFLKENSKNPLTNPYQAEGHVVPEIKDQKEWRVKMSK